MKFVPGLIGLLCLAACGHPMDSPAACAFELQASLPVSFTRGVPVAEVKVNGTPLRLVFDTGASNTVVTELAAARAGVARDSTLRITATGVGGQAKVQAGVVGRIEMATAKQTDMFVIILLETNFGKQVDGLLGADILSDYDLDLDMGKNLVRLYKRRSCPSGFPNWSEAANRLPRAPGGQAQTAIFIETVLDDVPLNAVIDTGAATTTVLRSRVLSMGVSEDRLANDRQTRTQGVAPGVQMTPVHQFKTLRIGGETIATPFVQVAPIGSIGNVRYDMLLGEDYLKKHRVWISYGSYTAFAVPTSP